MKYGKAPTRKHKRWAIKQRSVTLPYRTLTPIAGKSTLAALYDQLGAHALAADVATSDVYTVMVKLVSEPRAKRLGKDGGLTTRKASAEVYTSDVDAEVVAARLAANSSDSIERAWVARF